MSQRLGMDPSTAVAKRDAMQVQINALSAIANDLLTTYSAAQNPQRYGIDPGERTIAPWSMNHLSSARSAISGAHSSANTLLARLGSEVQAQQDASAPNGWEVALGGYGILKDISWWRRWVTWPRTLLELPAAIQMLGIQGGPGWRFGFKPQNWWLSGATRGGNALRTFTMARETPYWIRSMYIKGGNLKLPNWVNPAYKPTSSVGAHRLSVPTWMDSLKIKDAGLVSKISTTVTVVGKGFSVLGAIGGAVQLGTGIVGAMDGDVSSDDAWAMADGAVGLITGIGSLMPPPVGVVFAAAGLAYTAGRWLFGADENGKTGIDHIGDFANSTGQFLGDAAKNTGKFVDDAAKNVGNFVKDLWPW